MPRTLRISLLGLAVALAGASWIWLSAEEPQPRPKLDPAAWGDDHVGKPPPAYVTGDECLFCHRQIGAAWGDNPHQLTIRPAAGDPAMEALEGAAEGKTLPDGAGHLLGRRRLTRFLKRSAEYGKFELLSTSFRPTSGKLENIENPQWDAEIFGDRCAGCHATAVDAATKAFSAWSLDCFTCHGDVDLSHSDDSKRILLSETNREPRVVVSICGQCHLRTGRSQSTGRPYPNSFVAGDNLFRDFAVDLSDTAVAPAAPIDRHIYENIRAVAIDGEKSVTCLTCHDVHSASSQKHQELERTSLCASCHSTDADFRVLEIVSPAHRLQTHSRTCDY